MGLTTANSMLDSLQSKSQSRNRIIQESDSIGWAMKPELSTQLKVCNYIIIEHCTQSVAPLPKHTSHLTWNVVKCHHFGTENTKHS